MSDDPQDEPVDVPEEETTGGRVPVGVRRAQQAQARRELGLVRLSRRNPRFLGTAQPQSTEQE